MKNLLWKTNRRKRNLTIIHITTRIKTSNILLQINNLGNMMKTDTLNMTITRIQLTTKIRIILTKMQWLIMNNQFNKSNRRNLIMTICMMINRQLYKKIKRIKNRSKHPTSNSQKNTSKRNNKQISPNKLLRRSNRCKSQ